MQRVRVQTAPTKYATAPDGTVYVEEAGKVILMAQSPEASAVLDLLPGTATYLAALLVEAAMHSQQPSGPEDKFDRSIYMSW